MLNFGFWSSLKGMVKVPNLSGLTRTTASQSIIENGLLPVETGSTDTADDTLNQKIASQTPVFDTLVDYETNVSYTYYNFSFTPYSFTPYSFTPYSFTPSPPYTFTPQPVVTNYYGYCSSSDTPVGPIATSSTCAQALAAQEASLGYPPSGWVCGTTEASGTPSCVPTPVYSFTPTPTENGVWYTYCGNTSVGYAPGTVVGPEFWDNTTCAQVQQVLTQTGEIGSNFACAPGTSAGPPSVAAATCTTPVYSFTPYSFVPYTFTPYSFTPTPVYSFTPTPVYSFTPTPVYSFTPYSFTPVPSYSFTPLTVCIDEDTLVQVVGDKDSVEFKAAKDIVLGDKIWSITWDGLLDDLQDPGALTIYPENLENVKKVQSEIVQISPSTKETTLYFNGDIAKRFTPEEKVLIKRGSSHIFVEAKTIKNSDFIFEATDNGITATPVYSIDYIEETRNVFKFNAFPVDTIIAGNMVVHNSKV